jgi:hypothetical protein
VKRKIVPPPGLGSTVISMAAIQKAKAANKPMTEFLRDIPDVKVTTIISAGPGTVAQAPRKGGRKRRR